jgi:hydroxypyruvate isomerase
MFENSAGEDIMDQLQFMHDNGFRALEDNWMKRRPVEEQEALGAAFGRLDMEMGVFVAYFAGRDTGIIDKEGHEKFLSDIGDCVEVAKRCNATWMTVIPGQLNLKMDMGYQTANVVEALKRASDILEPHGLVMVLEHLNYMNHPGMFLTKVAQGYEICKAVNSPACKLLDDLYHQQIQEGNLIPNIDSAWDEIGYIQIGDNPGRNEPTTGEINYKNIFKHLHEKGYTGILGMEHGNAFEGKEGEMKLIEAYQSVDVNVM